MDRSHMTGKILSLTLKIIYLLTGEDYVPIKRSDDDTLTAPLSPSNERENDEKILYLTNKIIELLTGEGELMQEVKEEPMTNTEDSNNMHVWSSVTCKEEEIPISIGADQSSQTSSQDDDQNISSVEGIQWKEDEITCSGKLKSSHMHQIHLRGMDATQTMADLPVGCSVDPSVTMDGSIHIVVIGGEGDVQFKEEEEEIPIGSRSDCSKNTLLKPTRPLNTNEYGVENEDEESEDTETEEDEYDRNGDLNIIKSEEMESHVKIKREEIATDISPGGKERTERVRSKQDTTSSTADKNFFTIDRRLVTAEKPFFCTDCGGFFKHKSSLVLHRRIHSGEKPFSCSQCGKEFIQKANYIRHQRLHTGEKPYKCTECGKLYAQKQSLIMHQKFHAENEPFSCPECGENFMRQSHLVNHRKTHKGLKRYSCPDCGDFFMLRSSLVIHQRVHSAEKPFSS